jgi:hypothetical protein
MLATAESGESDMVSSSLQNKKMIEENVLVSSLQTNGSKNQNG